MTHKTFHLQPLINLAQHQTDAATRELGQRNKQQHDAEEKLEMLKRFRSDYHNRLHAAALNGMEPSELRNFQSFINKLDDAITQQLKVLEQSKINVQEGRTEFDSTQKKLKSFTTLQDRHNEEQRIIAAKSEQHALDEHTGRITARRKAQENDFNN